VLRRYSVLPHPATPRLDSTLHCRRVAPHTLPCRRLDSPCRHPAKRRRAMP